MQRDSYFETSDLSLAAALAALGIQFNTETHFIKVSTQSGEQYKFFFEGLSNCGKYKTGEMLKAWNDEQFHHDNPEHPFAFIKCAFKNRDGLLDVVKKSAGLVMLEKNGKVAILSSNASKEFQNKIFSQI